MKKLLLTLVTSGAIALSSFAQTGTTTASPATSGNKFSIGFDGGLPTGDASTVFGSVLGGSAKVEFATAKNTYLTISGGYSAYMVKSMFTSSDEPSSFGFMPFKAGLKYYGTGNFFLEGQAGIVFSTEKDGGHAFVYSPGIGYTFNCGLEAGIRYEAWSNDGTTSQAGFRLAYRF